MIFGEASGGWFVYLFLGSFADSQDDSKHTSLPKKTVHPAVN